MGAVYGKVYDWWYISEDEPIKYHYNGDVFLNYSQLLQKSKNELKVIKINI